MEILCNTFKLLQFLQHQTPVFDIMSHETNLYQG